MAFGSNSTDNVHDKGLVQWELSEFNLAGGESRDVCELFVDTLFSYFL
jgi:hypothetical protein